MAGDPQPPRASATTRWVLVLILALTGPAIVVAAAAVLPHRPPNRTDLTTWLDNPLTPRSVATVTVLAAVLLWATLAAAGVAAATRRTGWLTRVPLPRPAKTALLGLAGAAALTAVTTSAHPPHPAADSDTASPDPADPQRHPDRRSQPVHTAAGFDLADGSWIPRNLAEAVAAAATAVWWQRRRDYRPRTRPAAARDADLIPPTPTVAALTGQLTELDDPTAVEAAPASPRATAQPPPLHPADLPAGGLALTGDGGPAAARGILVAALLTGDTHVHTTTDTMGALLGAQHGPAVSRLHVAADLDNLVDQLHHHRGEQPVAVVATSPGDDTARLAQALRDTRAAAVILGPWPTGPVWHVATDGMTFTRDRQPPRRLCVLTAAAGSDLIALAATDLPAAAAPPPTPQPDSRPGRPAVAWRTELRLTLLGDTRLEHRGNTVHIRRTAGWQVLTYLALHSAGATAYQLCTTIWPHQRPHTIKGRLYTTISELRGQLPTDPAASAIERDGDTYHLNPSRIDVDLWHLTAAHQAADSTSDSGTRHRALQTIVDTYTGELAANRAWSWLHQPRETIRRHTLDAYAALADQAEPTAAIDLLHRAIHVDPVNNYLQRQRTR